VKNPFFPDSIDEAIKRVNNGTSTSIDHNYLEKEMCLDKYIRTKLHKLVGETIVYVCEFDKNKKFVREIKHWNFFNAGQARQMEKDVKRNIPPMTNGDEDRYVKIGYTHNNSKIRNAENRYDLPKQPGKGEMYPYDKKDELIKFCESIKDNYKNFRGVNPN